MVLCDAVQQCLEKNSLVKLNVNEGGAAYRIVKSALADASKATGRTVKQVTGIDPNAPHLTQVLREGLNGDTFHQIKNRKDQVIEQTLHAADGTSEELLKASEFDLMPPTPTGNFITRELGHPFLEQHYSVMLEPSVTPPRIHPQSPQYLSGLNLELPELRTLSDLDSRMNQLPFPAHPVPPPVPDNLDIIE